MVKNRAHPPSESTATFIRARLLKVRKDYPYNMWRLWKEHLKRLDMRAPMYDSFRHYIWVLKRANLIQRVSTTEKPSKQYGNLRPRSPSFYALVRDQIGNIKAWANPQVAVYGEKMRFGARKYRRKVLGLPPHKRGRKKIETYSQIESTET